MAAVAPIDPISIPTGLGAREVLDVGATSLSLQNIGAPNASIHQCAQRYGSQTIRSIFEKLELKDSVSSFEEICLADNNIGDDGAEFLMQGLTSTTSSGETVGKSLKVLNMPRTRMGARGMQAIGKLLAESTSLENVILSGNICDAEGVEGEFCTNLAKNGSVKSLCLAACRLGDQGVAALSEGPLKAHRSLEHVSLTYNRLEVAAAKSLAAMLATNTTLRFLDLSGNSLGPEGALVLVSGLKKNNKKLQRLCVAQNEIKLAGAKAFCQHFMSAEGNCLEYLDLRHNLVPFTGITELRNELGRPMDGPEGWMLLFGERQLLLNR